MAELDIGTIVILVVVMVLMAPVFMWIIDFILRSTRAYILKANDAHQALYRKHYKAAKTNIRTSQGITLERLYCEGDSDYYSMDYGKLKGIIWDPLVVEVFWKPSRLAFTRWGLVPRELVRDPLSKNLRIQCNGLSTVGNWYWPVYTRTDHKGEPLTQQQIWAYNHRIFTYEKYMLDNEKSVEIEEQKVHCIPESLQARANATRLVNRDDHLQKQETNEPRANAEDNAEEF